MKCKQYYIPLSERYSFFRILTQILSEAILFPSTQILIEKGHQAIGIINNTIKECGALQNEIEKITDKEIFFKNGSRICICELKEDNHIRENMFNITYFDDVIKPFINKNIK